MIHIYYGNGKGKTTAAFGLALRALGAHKKVAVLQFLKKGDSSEIKAIKKYKIPIDVFSFGIGFFKILGDKHTVKEHQKAAEKGLQKTIEIIKSKKYDLIILDEINVAIGFKLLDVNEVVKVVKSVPKTTELILTGRKVHPKLKPLANLITEMKNHKHYFDKGTKARKGIEF